MQGSASLSLSNGSHCFAFHSGKRSGPSGGSQGNAIAFSYPACTAPWSGTPDHWGYVDAPSAGNVLDCGALGTPRTTAGGDVVSFAVNALVVSA